MFLPLVLCVLLETVEHLAFSLAGRRPSARLRWMASGVALHLIALVVWLWLLTLLPLGVAMPLMGAAYITIPLASRWCFRERVDAARWLGIGAIVLGLVCLWAHP